MSSVNDISDAELVSRVVRSFRRARKEGTGVPRWSRVGHAFALGSTYAQQLCRRFGYDPDEKVRARG